MRLPYDSGHVSDFKVFLFCQLNDLILDGDSRRFLPMVASLGDSPGAAIATFGSCRFKTRVQLIICTDIERLPLVDANKNYIFICLFTLIDIVIFYHVDHDYLCHSKVIYDYTSWPLDRDLTPIFSHSVYAPLSDTILVKECFRCAS